MKPKTIPLFFLFFLTFCLTLSAASSPACSGNQVCIFTNYKATLPFSTVSRSDFSCPVNQYYTSGISPAGTDSSGELSSRNGIILAVDLGADVKAAATGLVVESAFDGSGLGYYLKLQHSENPRVFTVYGYLASRSVRQNERVNKGDVIGKSGSSGSAGMPALYFELVKDDRPTRDPESICPSRNRVEATVTLPAPKATVTSTVGTADCSRFSNIPVRAPWTVLSPGGRYGLGQRSYGGHSGFDFGGMDKGTPIYSVWPGTVLYTQRVGCYGNEVAILTTCSNGKKKIVTYDHLKGFSPDTKAGRVVRAGDLIAYLGDTGAAGDPACGGRPGNEHLHLMVFPGDSIRGRTTAFTENPEPLVPGGIQSHIR